jgi:4'-phosphopantetheinyl transferase EntD
MHLQAGFLVFFAKEAIFEATIPNAAQVKKTQ